MRRLLPKTGTERRRTKHGPPTAGIVVLVTFPFSDLSMTKLRPAVVLADSGRGDWILSQITSKPYRDSKAVTLSDKNFERGSLRITSYARPGKLKKTKELLTL
ncbi:hypothetical protein GMMP15_1230005 [Candidatus Magnetomoraceae bacterium gMMP-15]